MQEKRTIYNSIRKCQYGQYVSTEFQIPILCKPPFIPWQRSAFNKVLGKWLGPHLPAHSKIVVTTTYSTTKIHRKEWENCISWVTTTKEGVAVVSCWINDLSSKSWRLPFGLRNETSYFKVHKYPFSRHTGWQSKRNCLVVLPSALCCDAGWYSQCSKIGKIVQ